MRGRLAGLPFTVAVPVVGWIRSPMIRSSVDLPQPDGPISDTNSPGSISRSIPCTAVVSPNRFVTSLICTTLIADAPDGRRVDRSVRTAVRAEPVRPEGDDASVVSCEVLRRAPHDEFLRDQDDEEEGDAEGRGDHVGRPEPGRLRRVVLAVVDDLPAEAVLDRRRQLADDRADDARRRGDLE